MKDLLCVVGAAGAAPAGVAFLPRDPGLSPLPSAALLRTQGAAAVLVWDADGAGLHWLDTPHATGWLAAAAQAPPSVVPAQAEPSVVPAQAAPSVVPAQAAPSVVPAQAGTQGVEAAAQRQSNSKPWIPASAGMTAIASRAQGEPSVVPAQAELSVVPAQAGTQGVEAAAQRQANRSPWIPASAEMTGTAPGAQASTQGLDPAAFAHAWTTARSDGHVAADAALLSFPALPLLSWGEAPPAALPLRRAAASRPMGIYAIVDSAAQLRQVLAAGIRTVQLRIKQPPGADAAWHTWLRAQTRDSLAAASDAGAVLVVNDHWRLAAELGAGIVHLGQDDLLALGDAGRAELRATGMALGISSHAVWELCRARALAPAYIACGPVWPTTTKDMPWHPQGLDNLAWWVANAGTPVVAIGGILDAGRVRATARAGADGVCVLRGLGSDPGQVVPALQAAFEQGCHERPSAPPAPPRPHPTLEVRP